MYLVMEFYMQTTWPCTKNDKNRVGRCTSTGKRKEGEGERRLDSGQRRAVAMARAERRRRWKKEVSLGHTHNMPRECAMLQFWEPSIPALSPRPGPKHTKIHEKERKVGERNWVAREASMIQLKLGGYTRGMTLNTTTC